jgi:hypothetical protein
MRVSVRGFAEGSSGSLISTIERSVDMAEDRDLRKQGEEDLTEGPTPRIRRESGEPKQEHNTSEGPTPETREAERLAAKK